MNHLADETSPYLRQHADNPVEWFPWGDEALRRARDEDKPLFVSIGYASCHWCHVMAHESFEDPETAADLAKSFISVKVDREERPDLDTVYMAATQALTGSGGWPMSVFCTPDGRPFYAGTYFPPVERHGMPSFRRVVQALGDAWTKERAQVLEQADALVGAVQRELRLAEALQRGVGGGRAGRVGARAAARRACRAESGLDAEDLIEQVVAGVAAGFDPEWGGFGPAPKFPRPSLVELCLRQARRGRSDAAHARHMGLRTLDAMAAGGIYDHIVGGFCRYSTDARWLVPHFEKMLTDQAQLARAYLHAWQDGGRADYLGVVTETLDFVLRDLSTPEGALYSSFDADAGGVEGAHATFTLEELRADPARRRSSSRRPTGTGSRRVATGRGAPFRSAPSGAPLARPPEVEEARVLLAAARAERVQPARDEKVLTEWNAMTVATLAEVGGGHRAAPTTGAAPRRSASSSGPPCTTAIGSCAAGRAAGPVTSRWRRTTPGWPRPPSGCPNGRAGRSGASGRSSPCTNCSTSSGTRRPAGSSPRAAMPRRSSCDRRNSSTAPSPPPTPWRSRPSCTPAPWSTTPRIEGAIERTVALAGPLLERHPGALADMVAALPMVNGRNEIVVTGASPRSRSPRCARHWLPTAVIAWGEPDAGPLFSDRPAEPGLAYVCEGRACQMPAADTATLAGQLEKLIG